jgi:hypothetical protein
VTARRLYFLGERLGQLFPVKCFDAIEQLYRLTRLVALQWANQVQSRIGILLLQTRPLAIRLLHPVFTKYPMRNVEHRFNVICIKGFDTATSVISSGERPARAAAASIRAITSM